MASIWLTRPTSQPVSELVQVGQVAPNTSALSASEPLRVVAFIRHVGCPFSENTVKQLRLWAESHTQAAVFVVSHGDESATRRWVTTIGGAGRIRVVIDTERKIYGAWGIGFSGLWHFAGPQSLFGVVVLLAKGIRNRSASGTRWQRSATFMLQGERVIWSHVPVSAQEFELPPEHLVNADSKAA